MKVRFLDHGNKILILTDAVEEYVSKSDITFTAHGQILFVTGSLNGLIKIKFNDIYYPSFTTIADLTDELNRRKNTIADFHQL